MKTTAALSMVLAFGLLKSMSSARSQDDIAKQFVGMWRLVSWTERLADGDGEAKSAQRRLYCLHRYRSHVLCQHESESAPMEVGSRADTGRGFVCDHGPWRLLRHGRDSCERGICHPSRGGRETPNFVGRARKRWFTFEGPNRVSLRIDTPELTSPVVESILTWERVVK